VEHLDGPFDELLDALVSSALDILLDQLFEFGLQINGHSSTVSHLAGVVNFMIADTGHGGLGIGPARAGGYPGQEANDSASLRAPDRDDGGDGESGVDDFENDKRSEVHVVSFPSFEAFVVSARPERNQATRKGKESDGPGTGKGRAAKQMA
jgi:hypothetical protein